jgi:hypothetical protein
MPSYGELIVAGHDLLISGKLRQAYVAALAAAKTDPSRYEAYALAALVLRDRGAHADAKIFVSKAISLAPAERHAKLRQFAAEIDKAAAAASSGSSSSSQGARPAPAASVSGTSWSGRLTGAYVYAHSASKPLEATFTAALQPAGGGTASFNSLRQSVTWTQTGRYLVLESALEDYGCPARLTIRATVDGAAMRGVFSISGNGCADASGTWTATRVR